MRVTNPHPDRTIHARSGDNPRGELVRYDKAGKWYIEWPNTVHTRQRVNIAQAVETAVYWRHNGGFLYFGRHGGARFDTLLRRRL